MQRWPTRISIPRQSRFLASTYAQVVTRNAVELEVIFATTNVFIRMVPELILEASWPLSSLALGAITYWPRTGRVMLDAATVAPASQMSMVPLVENHIATALANAASEGDVHQDADVIAAAIAALFKAPQRMRTALLRLASLLPQQLAQLPNLAPPHPCNLAIM